MVRFKDVSSLTPPDFESYSLALFRDGEMIHSTSDPGLRPLYECLKKFPNEKDLMLHDKVQGLAAARMVTRSGIINIIQTGACSEGAFEHYTEKGILVVATEIVPNIMNQDKTDVCYMEKVAVKFKDDEKFFKTVEENFKE